MGIKGDGLVHGDAIWEIDPAYVLLRDDFLALNPQGGANGSSFTSQVPWYAVSSGSVSYRTNEPPYLGAVALSNSASINNSSFLLLNSFNGAGIIDSGGWPLLDYPSWKYVCNFMLQRGGTTVPAGQAPVFSMTKVSLYVGLGNWQPNGALVANQQPRPPVFCGLRFDTDPTAPAISDSQFVFEAVCNSASMLSLTRQNTQGNTFATGIVPAELVPYRLEIVCTVVGTVVMTLSVNGSPQSTATLTVPQYVNSPTLEYMSVNGYGAINFTSIGAAPCASGSLVTCTGLPTAFNGVKKAVIVAAGTTWFNFLLAGTVGQTAASGTATMNPALFPFISIGNSSQAAPVANQNGLVVDSVSFVWNPGVGGGTGTPNPTKSRFF